MLESTFFLEPQDPRGPLPGAGAFLEVDREGPGVCACVCRDGRHLPGNAGLPLHGAQ